MNIVLTGFMASGKTNISRALAELAGMDFADTVARLKEKKGNGGKQHE